MHFSCCGLFCCLFSYKVVLSHSVWLPFMESSISEPTHSPKSATRLCVKFGVFLPVRITLLFTLLPKPLTYIILFSVDSQNSSILVFCLSLLLCQKYQLTQTTCSVKITLKLRIPQLMYYILLNLFVLYVIPLVMYHPLKI